MTIVVYIILYRGLFNNLSFKFFIFTSNRLFDQLFRDYIIKYIILKID